MSCHFRWSMAIYPDVFCATLIVNFMKINTVQLSCSWFPFVQIYVEAAVVSNYGHVYFGSPAGQDLHHKITILGQV